jgi:hypothetical protein
MPRSLTTPITGQIMWYFSAASGTPPKAAIVTRTVDAAHFDLYVLDSVPATPTAAFVKAVLYNLTGQPALQSVASATLGAGGAGHVVNDVLTLANGVQITVLTVTAGAVTTFAVTNGGQWPAGVATPANPQAQIASSGVGTGATFNLTWAQAPWCTYMRVNEFTGGAAADGTMAMAAPAPMAQAPVAEAPKTRAA